MNKKLTDLPEEIRIDEHAYWKRIEGISGLRAAYLHVVPNEELDYFFDIVASCNEQKIQVSMGLSSNEDVRPLRSEGAILIGDEVQENLYEIQFCDPRLPNLKQYLKRFEDDFRHLPEVFEGSVKTVAQYWPTLDTLLNFQGEHFQQICRKLDHKWKEYTKKVQIY